MLARNGLAKKKKNAYGIPRTMPEKVFDLLNVVLMIFLMFITFYPFWNQVVMSIAPVSDLYKATPVIFPSGFNPGPFEVIFSYNPIWIGYRNTLIISIASTALTVVVTFFAGYPLSKPDLPFYGFFSKTLTCTMLFGGGLIPAYLLIRSLGWLNTYWALIVPGCLSAYNIFLVRNYIKTLPKELEESALIDGAGQLRILLQIIMPLSMPILATIALWKFVGEWQAWYSCLLYIDDASKQTLGLVARKILVDSDLAALRNSAMSFTSDSTGFGVDTKQLTAGVIVVTVAPMLVVYPFFQKYFVKGIVIGAIKG